MFKQKLVAWKFGNFWLKFFFLKNFFGRFLKDFFNFWTFLSKEKS